MARGAYVGHVFGGVLNRFSWPLAGSLGRGRDTTAGVDPLTGPALTIGHLREQKTSREGILSRYKGDGGGGGNGDGDDDPDQRKGEIEEGKPKLFR